MLSVTGRIGAVRISDGGGLAARGGHVVTKRRNPALLAGAVLACTATLAVAVLPSTTAPSNHPLASRQGSHGRSASSLPISLAPTVSASIGASERSFWPVHRGATLTAQGGGIHSTFTSAGAAVRVSGGTLALSLAAVGRGGRVSSLPAAVPTHAANQVLYRHGSIGEFYRTGPYGLEQGFSLPRRPEAGAGSLVLAIRLGGSLLPKRAGSRVLFRTHSGATALRYGQLSALDATGRSLPAVIDVHSGRLRLVIDDRNARYPLRIDPFIQQARLVASDEAGSSAEFGRSLALSADGSTALIGGPNDNNQVGAAWVFTRSGSTWTQQGEKLTASGEVGKGYFGASVALSSDGNTALIGGPGEFSPVGAAWVFTRSGGVWTQQAKLTGSGGGANNRFGRSVALSSDGNTALIGAPADNYPTGAAWVFTRSGSTWTQQGEKLTGGGESGGGQFGTSVALSADGNTALIGGPNDNRVGAAWVFTRSGGVWTQQGPKLTGGGEVAGCCGEVFGRSLALSADGNTALIGGPNDNNQVGAAWVFTRSGGVWTQQGPKLTGGGEVAGCCGGRFGESVALSADGDTALIGGHAQLVENNEQVVVWVFTRSGSTWTQQGEKLTGGGIGTSAGDESVALSADGNTALIGSNSDNYGVGAAWVFTRSGGVWSQQGERLTGRGEADFDFGTSLALSHDGNTALIGAPFDNHQVGAAWVFTRSGSIWTQQGPRLTAGDESGFDFGESVALSGDGNTAIIDGGGGAWVFTRSGGVWTQQGPKLTASDASGGPEGFGGGMALSADGSTALIGRPADHYNESPPECTTNPFGAGCFANGAAWVFTRSGSTWTQQAKLTGSGAFSGASCGAPSCPGPVEFGRSVALSADGKTALIGGPGQLVGSSHQGAAWVFTRRGSTWSQQGGMLTASGEGRFGYSVALSSHGETALIGAPGPSGDYSGHPGDGEAWVFTRRGARWARGPKLTGSLEEASFGASVALSSDGNTALIDAPHFNFANYRPGAAWVFTHSRSTWALPGESLECAAEGCPDVALSGDGSTALIGRLVFVNPPPHK